MKLSLLFLMFLFYNCSADRIEFQEVAFEFNSDFLLYICAKSSNGTMAGNFGEITIYDLKNNTAFPLTNDNQYQAYPTFSSVKNILVYDARPTNKPELIGLGGDSKIMYKNINHLDHDSVFLPYPNFYKDLKFRRAPFINSLGSKISFICQLDDPRIKRLVIYDIIDNSNEVLLDSMKNFFHYQINPDFTALAYVEKNHQTFESVLYIKNLKNKIVTQVKNVVEKDIRLGQFSNTELLFATGTFKGDNSIIHHLKLSKDCKILSQDSYHFDFNIIRSPVLYNNAIYFIGVKWRKVGDEYLSDLDNIYSYDLNSKQLTQLTTDDFEKEALRLYKF